MLHLDLHPNLFEGEHHLGADVWNWSIGRHREIAFL